MTAGEALDHILEPCRIAERDDVAGAVGVEWFAIPVAHHATCTFDNGSERGKVMKF